MRFFFFFSSRRRHTRWPRDWSSDVCSSDLRRARRPYRGCRARGRSSPPCSRASADRKSVVKGKSVDLGGRRIIKKKNNTRKGRKTQNYREWKESQQTNITRKTD